MITIQERVAAARDALRAAGIGADEAELSARLLAEHLLGWDATRYFTSANESEPGDFAARYRTLVARRAAREPSAYITGRQEFWGLTLEISPAVLIPRPETELIVEAALEVAASDRRRAWTIADACTGSGCVAIALARELPSACLVASDISETALQIAARNARRHAVAHRIRFVRTNVLDGIGGPFDLIVGNPPYVRRRDRPALQPEVRDYEPAVALFGGDSGVEVVETLIAQAAARLAPDGVLVFEFGFGQDPIIETLLERTPGLRLVGLRRDLQGIARTAIARRQAA
jgi:release factor glutamine methyltransferase